MFKRAQLASAVLFALSAQPLYAQDTDNTLQMHMGSISTGYSAYRPRSIQTFSQQHLIAVQKTGESFALERTRRIKG